MWIYVNMFNQFSTDGHLCFQFFNVIESIAVNILILSRPKHIYKHWCVCVFF